MEEITIQVALKPKHGRRAIVKGDKAKAIIEAVEQILDGGETLPKDFSLAEAAAMAIALGCTTPQEIIDYIKRRVQHP